MLNQFNGLGRLGRDPEMRNSSNGEFCTFPVCITKGSGDNQRKQWFQCTANGKNAENIVKYFRQGDSIGIVGEIQLREYEKNGEKKAVIGCSVWSFFFTGQRKEDNNNSAPPPAKQRTHPNDMEDVPF